MTDVKGQSSPAYGLLPQFAKLRGVWNYRAEAVFGSPAGLSAFFVTRYAITGRAYRPSDVIA